MGSTGIQIIRAGIEHADGIAVVQAEHFSPAWTAEEILRLLQQPASLSFVACAGSERTNVIGFILGQVAADEAEILSIAVAQDRQRHGLGARLLADWCTMAIGRGAARLFLDVAADNVAAVSMYAAHGFREINRRKAYYRRPDGGACDALMFAKQS